MSRARDLADSADKDIAGTLTVDAVDVQGTVTADGLTVGDTSVGQALLQMLANPTNGATTIHFGDGASADAYVGYINYAHDSNSMQFAANGPVRMRIDSSGIDVTGTVTADGLTVDTDTLYVDATNNAVGIGTDSPVANTPLTLQAASGYTDTLWLKSVGTNIDSRINIAPTGTGLAQVNNTNGTPIAFQISGTEAMRITSGGNVGLGVTPSASFAGYKTFQIASQGVISADTVSNGELEINNNAYRAPTTATPTYINSFAATKYAQYQGGHQWYNAPSGTAGNAITFTQAMTLDASGNLLVGSTTLDQANNSNTANCGINLFEAGTIGGSTNGAAVAYFNRLSSDGDIVSFRKDGAQVGSIGTGNGITTDLILDPRAVGGGSGISGAGLAILPMDHAQRADNHTDLGEAANRWKDLFLSGNIALTTADNDSAANMFVSPSTDFLYLEHPSNGMIFRNTSGTERMRIDSGGNFIFNENANDQDFRVKSVNNANMLVVDAANDQVLVGTSTPITGVGAVMTLGGLSDTRLVIDGSNSSGLYLSDSGAQGITIRNASGDLEFYGIATKEFAFNEDGADVNFRVASDNNANMLFVDAGNDRIGFGTGSPSVAFDFQAGAAGRIATIWDGGTNAGAMYNGDAVLSISRRSSGNTSLHGPIFTVGRDNSSSLSFNLDHSMFLVRSDEVVVNQDSRSDVDFRVESVNNANALFVDASSSRVGVGTSSLGNLLQVAGTLGIGDSLGRGCFLAEPASGNFVLRCSGLRQLAGGAWRQQGLLVAYSGVEGNLSNSINFLTFIKLVGLNTYSASKVSDIVGSTSISSSNGGNTSVDITFSFNAATTGAVFAVLFAAGVNASLDLDP